MKIFRRVLRREVGGRLYSEVVRRTATPNRYRDDLSVDGAWRFSESFDGARAWYRDGRHPTPTPATGIALEAYRWTATRLDHLQPLDALPALGCTVEDAGRQKTHDGTGWRAMRIGMGGRFVEMVYLDEHGRIAAHHLEVPEAAEDERDLEARVREWGEHDGLVHPVRTTVIDRRTGETVAEVVVAEAAFDPYDFDVFTLVKP